MALTAKSKKALSWVGLVREGLNYGKGLGLVSAAQHDRYNDALGSTDIDDLLGVAEFVGRKFEAPTGDIYARWMRDMFSDWTPDGGAMVNALKALQRHGVPIATLNYDTLAEQATGLPGIEFGSTELGPWTRKRHEAIFHLHGVWSNPAGCVFGIRDYQGTVVDDMRQFIQRTLSVTNQLLFVGCGDTFLDPNFSFLISWLRTNVGANAPQHYALVRDDEVPARLADPAWRGFVEPLGYGADHSKLAEYLLGCFPTRPGPTRQAAAAQANLARQNEVIEAYRRFLVRDCGEMSIEGMRADMETAQRKFDLEKLFVPLEVQPFPPEFALSDPDRDAKAQSWERKHGRPVNFSKAFTGAKHMALLALPGGGKTMLLKRLAVAYADPSRRVAGPDDLPDVDLIPVMIRCREWKDVIRRPFPTLLKSIASITGEQALEGLAEALEGPLAEGRVLLLVDGLDEIHKDADREIFAENLEKFLEKYPNIQMVTTSREAGFELVAPRLARFCAKYKIAPLNDRAIQDLSEHWHRLMSGETPEAKEEAESVTETLITSDPLRRLAENPLMLTMLLVVKHGAGRLPPDRVSLYERAVEVLLDTWNIKGHEALNVREAVPQLACLAFELMKRGVQTATEREILEILEEARAKRPMIGRYAKDSAHEFLKRVELRSSLLLEGGHKVEGGKPVPFYQFRHLTFQEYLAAVAAVEGHTLSAKPESEVDAIGDDLLSSKWKEIIPMAAVLARGQADELLLKLVIAAEGELAAARAKLDDRIVRPDTIDPATNRLTQAMVEEAVFSPAILDRAAPVVTWFSSGRNFLTTGRSSDQWRALSRGIYGPDLRVAAMRHYLEGTYANRMRGRTTLSLLEAHQYDAGHWLVDENVSLLLDDINADDIERRVRGLLSVGGAFYIHRKIVMAQSDAIYEAVERGLFDERVAVQQAAVWTWGFWKHLQIREDTPCPQLSPETLGRIISLYFEYRGDRDLEIDFVLLELVGIGRDTGPITLSDTVTEKLRAQYDAVIAAKEAVAGEHLPLLRIIYMLPTLYSDAEVVDLITTFGPSDMDNRDVRDILDAYGLSIPKPGPQQPDG